MGAEFQLEMMMVKAEMGGGCGHTTVRMCFAALIGHSKGKITSSTLCVFYGNKKKTIIDLPAIYGGPVVLQELRH